MITVQVVKPESSEALCSWIDEKCPQGVWVQRYVIYAVHDPEGEGLSGLKPRAYKQPNSVSKNGQMFNLWFWICLFWYFSMVKMLVFFAFFQLMYPGEGVTWQLRSGRIRERNKVAALPELSWGHNFPGEYLFYNDVWIGRLGKFTLRWIIHHLLSIFKNRISVDGWWPA